MEKAETTFAAEALHHLDALYALARWLVGDPAEAEDLVQETYAKALRAVHQFQNGSNLRAWLMRILRNTFYTHAKRQARAPQASDPAVLEQLASQDAATSGAGRDGLSMLAQDLTAALRQLPEEYRSVVLLADLEDYTMAEISTIMACPVGTVKSRLFRARAACCARSSTTTRADSHPDPPCLAFPAPHPSPAGRRRGSRALRGSRPAAAADASTSLPDVETGHHDLVLVLDIVAVKDVSAGEVAEPEEEVRVLTRPEIDEVPAGESVSLLQGGQLPVTTEDPRQLEMDVNRMRPTPAAVLDLPDLGTVERGR